MTAEQIAFVHGTRPLPRLEYGHWAINLWGKDGELVQSFDYPVGTRGPCDSAGVVEAAQAALAALG